MELRENTFYSDELQIDWMENVFISTMQVKIIQRLDTLRFSIRNDSIQSQTKSVMRISSLYVFLASVFIHLARFILQLSASITESRSFFPLNIITKLISANAICIYQHTKLLFVVIVNFKLDREMTTKQKSHKW